MTQGTYFNFVLHNSKAPDKINSPNSSFKLKFIVPKLFTPGFGNYIISS